jgi:pyruvate/2-oxoacid:ferredoxin oxidoreductase beta subunit
MGNRPFLATEPLHFCGGCGHRLIARNTERALQRIVDLQPLDVILVTDIGCHGIIDRSFLTHTIHGLHGRSIALAAGISAGLERAGKEVIVFIGDGGATIGLQHLIEAAHRNFNMTVVIHNNMLYGMTGGQSSGLTPCGYKTKAFPEGQPYVGYDLCRKANNVGAAYARRIIGTGDFSDYLEEAITTPGFSLVEVVEVCPSYGAKRNRARTLSQIVEQAGLKVQLYSHPRRESYSPPRRTPVASLIDPDTVIPQTHSSTLAEPRSLSINGSAGEGVQSAAGIFARAAVAAGLHVTKKESYPVTVGVGFSTSELIVSPDPILHAGLAAADAVIVTSKDGLERSEGLIGRMKRGLLLIDESLDVPETVVRVVRRDFRGRAGARSAALVALFHYLDIDEIFPTDCLANAVQQSKLGGKLDLERIMAAGCGRRMSDEP